MNNGQTQPLYVACGKCGACVLRHEASKHTCDRERWLDFQVARLRPDLARFEAEFGAWLETSRGAFELFYARHCREHGPEAARTPTVR